MTQEHQQTPGQPVVHVEIIGRDPQRLQQYYAALFGWSFVPGDAASDLVSAPGQYGFLDAATTASGGINGGVGGGPGFTPHVLFYVGVPDVEAALVAAERLGGRRVMGPEPTSGADIAVGQFTDPEGNRIGVAGPPVVS